jgi:hypothetical protein
MTMITTKKKKTTMNGWKIETTPLVYLDLNLVPEFLVRRLLAVPLVKNTRDGRKDVLMTVL